MLCPLHADEDPCLITARVTGRRRKGSVRRGVCSNCGWSGPRPLPHDARPDDDSEPGDRCKDCGLPVTWVGPSLYDWQHVDADPVPAGA